MKALCPTYCADGGPEGAAGTRADAVPPVFRHESVLAGEVTAWLAPSPGRIFADLTLGGGGHSERLLEAGAAVLGLDRDPEALAAATNRLKHFGVRFRGVLSNFARFDEVCARLGAGPFDGILLDLGVSSHQLDTAGRGFSFLRDGPLDMRMGSGEAGPSAADLVNTADAAALARIFREYGEEPQAGKAARAIVAARAAAPFRTTLQLADCLERTLGRKSGQHPGTRIFQALRIAVNGELEALQCLLRGAHNHLLPGGRLAVISFHSLEDRIVKQHFRSCSRPSVDRPEWPEPRPNPDYHYRDLTRKAVEPGAEELARNPRARSAKLRVVERRPV